MQPCTGISCGGESALLPGNGLSCRGIESLPCRGISCRGMESLYDWPPALSMNAGRPLPLVSAEHTSHSKEWSRLKPLTPGPVK